MTTGGRDDPVLAYNFLVALADSATEGDGAAPNAAAGTVGGFSECSGLALTLELEDYREGGLNTGVRHFPTRATWGNIRLRRGIAVSDELWRWHEGFVNGHGKRRDGTIQLRDDRHQVVKEWRFRRGIPVRWTGPTLDAAQSRVAIEELEIAHEGLELGSAGGG